MTRRLSLVLVVLMLSASSAWAKFNPQDQAYLDNQFKAVQSQIEALKAQIDTLTATLAELRQSQAQFQAVVIRQQRSLDDLDQLVSAARIANEENYSALKKDLDQLRADQQKAFSTLSGQTGAAPTPVPSATETTAQAPTAPPPTPAPKHYITDVKGDVITVDMGSAEGTQVGAKLALFKSGDPNTKVGDLEITEVVGAEVSHARIVSVNSGITPEFSDVVRPE